MQKLLVNLHMHMLMMIVAVIIVPLIVNLYRKQVGHRIFNADENNKLRLDVATIIPIGVLLWNLLVYYAADIIYFPAAAFPESKILAVVSVTEITFEKAIASTGESTVALATAIIFCRLFGDIWADCRRKT